MIDYKKGSLFESEMQTLVNATNTEGIMGGGIALAFKQRYPAMYTHYVDVCNRKIHTPLRPFVYQEHDHKIVCLATKTRIAQNSTLGNIGAGMAWIIENYKACGVRSIAFPALGCGLGGLRWEQVQPLMYRMLSLLDIPVEIYLPGQK